MKNHHPPRLAILTPRTAASDAVCGSRCADSSDARPAMIEHPSIPPTCCVCGGEFDEVEARNLRATIIGGTRTSTAWHPRCAPLDTTFDDRL